MKVNWVYTLSNERTCSNTCVRILSSQKRSNKQSIQVEFCRIKLLAFSSNVRYSLKSSMENSTHLNPLLVVSKGSANLMLLSSGHSPVRSSEWGKPFFFPNNWTWIHATLSTRAIASKDLKEERVCATESWSILCRLFKNILAISGVQIDCSRVSNSTEHSGCQNKRRTKTKKIRS